MNSDNDAEHGDEIIATVSQQELDSLTDATANEQVTSEDDQGDPQSRQLPPPQPIATVEQRSNNGGSKQAREQKTVKTQSSTPHEGNYEDARLRRERQNRTNEDHDYRVRVLREHHQRVNEVAPVVQANNRNWRATPSLKEIVRTTILAGAGSAEDTMKSTDETYVSTYGTLHIHVANANRLMAEMSTIRVIGTRCNDSRISSHGLEKSKFDAWDQQETTTRRSSKFDKN